MEKVIVVDLDACRGSKSQEILTEYLNAGWSVKSISCTSAAAGAAYGYGQGLCESPYLSFSVSGWALIVLEKA
jgi:hypothetical protein